MQKQGSTMLKVVSILMIVFSSLGLLTYLFLIVGLADEGLWDMASRYGYGMGTFNIALICLVLANVMELVAGIVGVNSWYKKEKAGTCIGLGYIIIGLIVLGVILEIVFFGKLSDYYRRGTFEGMSAALAILGLIALVVPVLYLIGAYKLKNMQFQPVNYNSYYNNGYNQGYGNTGYTNQNYANQGYTGQQGYTNQGYTGQQGYTNQGYTGQQGYTNQGYTGQQSYTNPAYTGQQANAGQTYPWQQNYNNQGYTGQSSAYDQNQNNNNDQ